jgi:L-iditol 2-dehydrogenase
MKSLIEYPKTMKALVLHEIGRLTLDEVEVPKLTEGTVLVKIKACGICSSDVERVFINGTYHFPTIPGHEFSGQIVAVADGVDESLLGKRTCVFPMLPCFTCTSCKKKQYAQCANYNYFGSRCDGGYAEYLVVPVWNLVPFSDDLPYDVAALCEPAAVGIHANNLADVKEGQTVLVIGSGMIAYVIAAFAAQKTDKVIMCGNSEKKLELAKKMGFLTIALAVDDFEEKINEYTNGEGADAVFEVVGSNTAISNAIKGAAALSTVVMIGNPKEDLVMEKNLYWKILRKQITVKGSWNSSYNDEVNDWKTALEKLSGGAFDTLITHCFPMSQSKEAFDVVRDKNVFTSKVMFVMEEEE